MRLHLLSAVLAVALLAAPIAPVFAAETVTKTETAKPAEAAKPADVFTDKQRAAIDAAIKDYINDNPQVLISSVEAYYNKQNETKKVQEGPLTQFPAGLLDYPGTPYVGPKDAKLAVVEFFDYNCGYCKQVASDVARLIEEEKSVKIIFKELPILSDSSAVAARYALAANMQGKYLDFHNALMTHQGPMSEELAIEAAKTLKLDIEKLKKDANAQDVRDALAKNVELARELGVRGTPFFVVGKQKLPGAVGFSKLKEMIAQERGDTSASAAAKEETKPAEAAAVPATEKPAEKVSDVKTESKTEPKTEVKTETSATEAAAATPAIDAESQSEIAKAQAEAKAMIEEIKAEATKMQEQAAEAQKKVETDQKATATKAAEPAKTETPKK